MMPFGSLIQYRVLDYWYNGILLKDAKFIKKIYPVLKEMSPSTIFIFQDVPQSVYEGNCPSGHTSQVGTKKFYYHSSQVTWNSARSACITEQMYMATFENNDEFQALAGMFSLSDKGTFYY